MERTDERHEQNQPGGDHAENAADPVNSTCETEGRGHWRSVFGERPDWPGADQF
jgi:hypothetical protein